MQMPDLSNLGETLRDHLPEVWYASVEEAELVNRQRMEHNVAYFRDNPEGIERRLAELELEWDTSRVLQVGASAASLAGFWFALTRSRVWLLLPMVMAGGALHHGLTGCSPAEDLVRRMGVRTRHEIEAEARALESLRGSHAGH